MLSTTGLGVPGRGLSLLRILSRCITGLLGSSLVPFASTLVSVHFCSFRPSWLPVTTKLTSLCRKLSTLLRIRKKQQRLLISFCPETSVIVSRYIDQDNRISWNVVHLATLSMHCPLKLIIAAPWCIVSSGFGYYNFFKTEPNYSHRDTRSNPDNNSCI